MTNLMGRLPKDNGLGPITQHLIDTPAMKHVVLMVVDCRKVTTDMDSGEVEPTARILRIEAVRREDYEQAAMLMRRSLEDRHGSTVLPFDTEKDLEDLFKAMAEAEGDTGDEKGDGE